MNNNPILKLNQSGKEYDGRWAVKDLNLSVFPGEIYGFLGRNGAGKTTTIRMIMGLIHASTGSIELFGKQRKGNEPLDNEVFRDIAATIEYPGFYPNLTAKENLMYYAKMLKVCEKKVNEELILFGLEDAGNRLVKGFSLGMKQRLGLARAMLRNPKLLILDEPTNGLDPAGIREIRESILRLNTGRGITILFSSHILSEVELIATRIGVIHKGELVDEFTLDQFHQASERYLELRVSNQEEASQCLKREFNLNRLETGEDGFLRVPDSIDEPHRIVRSLVQQGIDISHFSTYNETLEERFMRLTGEHEHE